MLDRYDEPALRVCILRDAIVTYAKPFSANRGQLYRMHRLTEDFVADAQRPLHRELIILRDQSFAHTDHDFRDPSVSRWHGNDGTPVYLLRFRVVQWLDLNRRSSEIRALVSAVEENVGAWISWFEREYSVVDEPPPLPSPL